MKKRIANGLELVLLLVSFVIMWIPCISVQYVELIRELPLETNVLGLVPDGSKYMLLFLYAVNALLCVISILVKPEHRDGKLHVILPIMLIFFASPLIRAEVGEVIYGWEVVKSSFPSYLYWGCLFGAFVISIAKRSTIIAGLPNKEPKRAVGSNADELKKYKELLDSGVISQEEFDAKKKQLLGL